MLNSTSTPETSSPSAASASSLAERYRELSLAEPRLRQREAAERLGCSEGALVACRLGTPECVRLNEQWLDILRDLEAVGPVMALTRNEHAVIEKTGRYRNVTPEAGGAMGQVLGDEIDLRLFLRSWGAGFAYAAPTAHGTRQSLQFYTRSGEAIHKVFETAETDRAAFAEVIARYRHPEQHSPFDGAVADEPPAPERPDAEVDRARLLAGWEALTDTHQFFHLIRRVGASRTQALRLGAPRWAERVQLGAWRALLERAAAEHLKLMVFVGSRGVMEIHTGPIHQVKAVGEWFNILDPGFNLHLFEPGVSEAWVVRKPAEGIVVSSLELYDRTGGVIALFFVKRKEGEPAPEAWTQLLAELPRP
ncbi:MAG TPA: ChuX/HutX family heme-like substrate-binding protein [Polyangiaceae bacterium]|nr:ChuX/HutX family heme-like substrate-binding protein [Polyangiaceae bacterium]